jgi:glycosyltransferase involved in cell wall biosynthesis
MRILHLVSSPATSGVTATIKLLALGLRERGHAPHFAHFEADEGIAPELRRAGIPVHRIAAPPRCFGPLRTRWIASQARRLVGRLAPDLIHAQSFDADLIACRAARGRDIPVIATMQSFSFLDWAREHPGLYAKYGKPLRKLIAVSDLLGRKAAQLPALKDKSFETVLNVPQKSFFEPVTPKEREDCRRRLGLADDELAVVCVANFHPIKGQEILAQAFELLRQRRGDVRLILVGTAGGDARRQAFQRQVELILAEALALGRAKIIGDAADSRPFLAAADVYVQPSHMEALGVAITEAMACGLPVAATNVGGIPELVSEASGLLVPPADPRELARAIERLADSPPLRQSLGAGGKAFALKFLTESFMLDEHERIYAQCLAGRDGQRH